MPVMQPPATTAASASSRPAQRAGRGRPVAGGKAGRGEPGQRHGRQRQNVSDGDEHGGRDHGARIVALRILNLLGDGGSIVPAHVVPHGHQDRRGEGGPAPSRLPAQSRPIARRDAA